MSLYTENNTQLQANNYSNYKNNYSDSLQSASTQYNLWKLRKPFLEQACKLLKLNRHASAAKEVLSYFLTVCDNDTGVSDISVETLAENLGCSIRKIKYGTQLLSELGIIDIKQRGFMRSNLYILNIESLGIRPITYEVQTVCIHSTKNKNINEKGFLESKRQWIEPEPLPPDFDFSDKEKQIIAETYKVEPEKISEAIAEWKIYNHGRLGYNWFQSFNGFCARRNWYKQTFKRGRRYIPITSNITPQSSIQAQMVYRTNYSAEKMKSYKKKYPKKEALPTQIDIIKIESEYNSALLNAGITNEKHRHEQIKHLMKQTFYGYN